MSKQSQSIQVITELVLIDAPHDATFHMHVQMHSDVKQKPVCPKPRLNTMPVLTPVCSFFKALNVFKALSDTKVALPLCSMHQKTVDCAKFIQDTDGETALTEPPQSLIEAEIG